MCKIDLTMESGFHKPPRKTKTGVSNCKYEKLLLLFFTAPAFNKPLLNQTAEVGGRVQFKCYVSGSPKPGITWYKNGKIIKNKSGLFSIIDRCVLYHCWM